MRSRGWGVRLCSVPKIIGGSLAEHREQVRERLFTAMMELLVARGYDSITLADVAAAARLGRTAVYNHFPDKESVLLALVESRTDAYLERLHSVLATVHNPIDRLEAFVRMQLTELAGHGTRLAGVGSVLSEPGRARIAAHISPMVQLLGEILTDGIAQRYLPEQDVKALVGLVSAVTAGRTTVGLEGDELRRAIDAAVMFVLRGVGARFGPGPRPRRIAVAAGGSGRVGGAANGQSPG